MIIFTFRGWTPHHHGGADTQPLPQKGSHADGGGAPGRGGRYSPAAQAPLGCTPQACGPCRHLETQDRARGQRQGKQWFVGRGILRVRGKGFRNNTPRHRGQQAGQGSSLSYSGEKEAAYRGGDVHYQGNQQLGRSLPTLR